MKLLGIYGSPRKGGNTDILLDKALEGAKAAGAEVEAVYARKLDISGCRECGGCDKTGKCVVKDPMQEIYPKIQAADIIILASPIFFYDMSAQVKLLIDRCQAMWAKRMLEKTKEERKHYDSGKGYLIAVGATRGSNLFTGVELTAKYFFDALDMSYEGGLFYRRVDKKGAILENSDALKEAFELGSEAVKKFSEPIKT
ncbi:flavodoxin family protein [Candidatus Poribacteria bacterium]|nr:flavodoxin family protein [Candidatus Poribacteria bacterium]